MAVTLPVSPAAALVVMAGGAPLAVTMLPPAPIAVLISGLPGAWLLGPWHSSDAWH